MSWTLIEHQALTSSAASVTLGSGGTIPQTYKSLILIVSSRTNSAAVNDYVKIGFNGSTANFTARGLGGDGASAFSYTQTNFVGESAGANSTASTFGSLLVTIPNYAGSTNKPFSADGVGENNGTTAYQSMAATLWNQTAAITSMALSPGNGTNFVSGSTFTLYGLA